MDDDLFDIIGFCLFTSNDADENTVLPSCDDHKVQGKCVYESEESEDR
jgi:hypothetical protein